MKIAEAILATTHVDSHKDVIALSALQGAVEQVKQRIIPVLVEHDPRQPPLGRIVSSRVEQLADGHFALIGTMELFEPDDHIPLSDDPREIHIAEPAFHKITVICDRSYSEDADQSILEALVTQIGGVKEEYTKKALVPLSVLAIVVGTFGALKFAGGFLEKAGADTWDALRGKLKQLMSRKRVKMIEHVLQFQFIVPNLGKLTTQSIIYLT